MRFAANEPESAITARLPAVMENLLTTYKD
jgi:hypothetical protein